MKSFYSNPFAKKLYEKSTLPIDLIGVICKYKFGSMDSWKKKFNESLECIHDMRKIETNTVEVYNEVSNTIQKVASDYQSEELNDPALWPEDLEIAYVLLYIDPDFSSKIKIISKVYNEITETTESILT